MRRFNRLGNLSLLIDEIYKLKTFIFIYRPQFFLTISVIAVILIGLIWKVPQLQVNNITDAKDRGTLENANRSTLIQAIGGLFFFVTAYFSYQNLKVTQEKQVTERFAKATEQLGSENIHVRLGAIYALERISKDSDKDYWQVMEILTAYVRSLAPYPPTEKAENIKNQPQRLILLNVYQQDDHPPATESQKDIPPIRIDIQAVLTVISRRAKSYNQGEKYQLDFRKSNLRGANFRDANLIGANLSRAYLRNANFRDAYLWDAYLWKANLSGANLWNANFRGANLSGANLSGANLSSANLSGANLSRADLSRAYLGGADLGGANLSSVQNITPEQVKFAKNWEEAEYDKELRSQLGLPPETTPHIRCIR
ncbi:pentapeptide repeat-containing protein [Nostoc sp. FACHB-133]|uniref:pentapeptide repeat-containing protein n=1 Tax=Nostoc sp. FACHB-133 TaxID=2692835 RepID=UPI0016839696|nr:pentapeptide repeat-containing protein [Nostoc sp. FACHB-133]MBD2527973.1 pentapeptide repeat-containing protein [Nostoc sp. FACHB-133]